MPNIIIFTLFTLTVLNASTWLNEKSNYRYAKDDAHAKKEFVIKNGEFPTGDIMEKISDAKVYIMDMDYALQESNLTTPKIDFSAPNKGSYQIFFEHKYVRDNTLFIELSKLRTYNQNGDIKKSILKEIRGETTGSHYDMKPLENIPFEIVMRKPFKQHHINCCLYSGDIARFQVYFENSLQKNIPLNITTQLGWKNIAKPSDDGMISFEIPRDKYVDTTINKRFRESLLVEADYLVQKDGIYNDSKYSQIHYSMTLPLAFYTSPLEYSSKLSGFFVVIGVMLVFALGAYYYRKKKRKSHKEIWFEEN